MADPRRALCGDSSPFWQSYTLRMSHCIDVIPLQYIFYVTIVVLTTALQRANNWERVGEEVCVCVCVCVSACACVYTHTHTHTHTHTQQQRETGTGQQVCVCVCFTEWLKPILYLFLTWLLKVSNAYGRRSQWPRGRRRRSAAARLPRLWVRIPPRAWMSVVSVVCCQVEVSATSWSLVQRSPTDRDVSLCVI